MVGPQSTEEDDLPSEPPRSHGVEGEENFEPEDDEDLGLGDEDEVGLDADVGPEDAFEFESTLEDEDDTSWLDDGRDTAELALDDDGPESEGDEREGLDDCEPDPQAEDWDEDFGFDDAVNTLDDAGEEGFGDDALSGLDLDGLPPLDDSGADEDTTLESDPLTANLIAALGTRDDDEELEEIAPGLFCARLAAERVRMDVLHASGRPLHELAAAEAAGVAWDGQSLLVADAEAAAVEPRFESGEPVHALSAACEGGRVLIALGTPNGVRVSQDGGRTLAAPAELGEPGTVAALAFARANGALRLWAANAAGPLYASDDLGATFRTVLPDVRVLALASDGADALAVLGRGEGGAAQALYSLDGGAQWDALELPVHEPERVQILQIAGEAALCCRRAPQPQLLVRGAPDETWVGIDSAEAPALLLAQAGAPVLYFCVTYAEGARLVRRWVGEDGARTPQIVADLPHDAGVPLQLAGVHRDGVTTLHVAAERAWYRFTLRDEGEAR